MRSRKLLKNFRLKQLRREVHISQEELANALGASKSDIVAWEELERDPPVRYVIQMAMYFECSTDYLLGLSDDEGDSPNLEEEYENEYDEDDCDEERTSLLDRLNGDLLKKIGKAALIIFAIAFFISMIASI